MSFPTPIEKRTLRRIAPFELQAPYHFREKGKGKRKRTSTENRRKWSPSLLSYCLSFIRFHARSSKWNLGVVFGGRKTWEPDEKNLQSTVRTNYKLNPHETASTGIEPGSQRWEASAYPLRPPCSSTLKNNKNNITHQDVSKNRESATISFFQTSLFVTACWIIV